MKHSALVQRDFDRAAAEYDRHAGLQRDVLCTAYAAARRYFGHASVILDIGAGTGAFAALARQDRWRAAVYAVDLSYRMCAESRRKGGAAINADMASLPFADGVAEGVFSSLALQWAEHPQPTLGEWHRCLKPSGAALVTLFSEGTLSELKAAFACIDDYPHLSDFAASGDVLSAAVKAGFQVIACKTQSIRRVYADAKALARSLRSIGAANKRPSRRKSMISRGAWQRLEAYYRDRFPLQDGIYATWNVTTLALRKPA